MSTGIEQRSPTRPEKGTTTSSPLYTERLVLTLFDPSISSDYDKVISVYNSPFGMKGLANHNLREHADLDLKCQKASLSPDICTGTVVPPSHAFHLIHLQDTGEFVGWVSLFHRKPASPDLGWALLEQFARRGYATEASKEALRFWREEVGVRDIWAATFPENSDSQRVAEKVGFVPGGTLTINMPNGTSRICTAFVLPGMARFPEGYTVAATVT